MYSSNIIYFSIFIGQLRYRKGAGVAKKIIIYSAGCPTVLRKVAITNKQNNIVKKELIKIKDVNL